MFGKALKYIALQFSNPHGFGGYISALIMNCSNWRQYKAVQKYISLQPNEKVLDIGFGNGCLIKRLHKKYPVSEFHGIDISEDMLHIALKRNAAAIRKGNMQLSHGDVVALPFKDNSFDKIYTVNTMYFWKDVNKGMQEIKRIMKEDALFVIVGHYQHYLEKLPMTKYNFKNYSLQEIESLLTLYGFILIENITVEKNKSYCLIARKH